MTRFEEGSGRARPRSRLIGDERQRDGIGLRREQIGDGRLAAIGALLPLLPVAAFLLPVLPFVPSGALAVSLDIPTCNGRVAVNVIQCRDEDEADPDHLAADLRVDRRRSLLRRAGEAARNSSGVFPRSGMVPQGTGSMTTDFAFGHGDADG